MAVDGSAVGTLRFVFINPSACFSSLHPRGARLPPPAHALRFGLRHGARCPQRVQAGARTAPAAVLPEQLQRAVRRCRVRAQAVPRIRC